MFCHCLEFFSLLALNLVLSECFEAHLKVWLMCQSPYGGLVGECTAVVSESLQPGTGSNILHLGNFGSISASVQQKTSRLGRNLSGEHTALRHLKIRLWVCHLNSTKDTFVVVDFFPPL